MADRIHAEPNSFPIAHRLLAAAGILLPEEYPVWGDFNSEEGVSFNVDRVWATPGTEVITAGGVVYLMEMGGDGGGGLGVKGKFKCACRVGDAGCGTLTSVDPKTGNPGMGCVSEDCNDCILMTILPPTQLAALALRALDIQLERGAFVVGDIGSEAVTNSRVVFLGPDCPFTIERGEDGFVYMMGNNGATMGTFDCHCKSGSGGCSVEITDKSMVCVPGKGCTGCVMPMKFPGLQLSLGPMP